MGKRAPRILGVYRETDERHRPTGQVEVAVMLTGIAGSPIERYAISNAEAVKLACELLKSVTL